ncbi:calcium/sodium antiporter [Nocardioides salsibiostraticola]
MALDAAFILGGLVLLFFGGDLLVRGSVRLAERMGVSPLFVGLVLVGFGTSAPELFASIEAVRVGAPAIAWGNVVGSNVANTLLILGVAAVVAPFPTSRGTLWRDGGFGLAAAALLLVFAPSGVSRPMGLVLIAILVAYLTYAYVSERRQPAPVNAGGPPSPSGGGVGVDLGTTLGGLVLIIIGGNILVGGARDVAASFGLSDTLIGLTIVAIGTSAPELATSVVAARKGQGGIAFGNVLGSNIYNILAIGGTTAVLAPNSLPSEMVTVELPLLVVVAVGLLVFGRTGHRFTRWEGLALVAAYAGYLTFAVLRAIV